MGFAWIGGAVLITLIAWAIEGKLRVGAATVQSGQITTVSAASYSAEAIAPDSIVAGFGSNLATTTAVASSLPLPTELVGTSVEVNGRRAGLFFVSPNQLNYLIPAATETGTATVVVKAGTLTVATGSMQVRQTGPALFTANASGQGALAAYALRVSADGTQRQENIFQLSATGELQVTRPIAPGRADDRIFLVLFLSGIRKATDPNGDGNVRESVRVVLGNTEIIPDYAGVQGTLAGLDQVNVEIPRSLFGQGFLNLRVRVTGAADSNMADIELLIPPGAGPTASDLTTVTDEDQAKALALTGSDPSQKTLTYRVVNQPLHGTLSGTASNLIYTPLSNYHGADSFQFVSSNGAQTSNAGTVFISIRSVNDPPVLSVPGAQTVSIGNELSFQISAIDPDTEQTLVFADPEPLPAGATYSRISNTTARFTWTPGFALTGSYTLKFRVTDSSLPPLSDTKNVTVAVVFQSLNGQKWGTTSGPEGGQISFLIADGGNVYAGVNGSGIYFSGDRGLSWREITEVNTRLQDVFLKTVAVGAGNLFVTHFASSAFPSVFRSSNGGLNWAAAQSDLGDVGKPVVNVLARSGSALLAGTESGLWRSTNGGDNWVQISSGIPANLGILSLTVSSNTVFAGTRNGIYQSSDQGSTWALSGLNGLAISSLALTDSMALASASGSVYRADLNGAGWALFTSGFPTGTSVTSLAAIGTSAFAGTGSGVYRLTGGSSAWNLSSTGIINRAITTLAVSGTTLLAGSGGGGIYRSTSAGDSWTSASSGLAGAITPVVAVSGNNLFAATEGAGVQRSTNNGQSWTLVNSGLPSLSISTIATTAEYVFAGINGSGVFRSGDSGESWVAVNSNLAGLNVSGLAVDGETLFVSTGGAVYRSTNYGDSWNRVSNLSGFRVIVRSGLNLFAGGGSVFRSADNGLNWTQAANGIGGSVTSLAATGAVLTAGTNNASPLGNTYRSLDQGQSWQPLLTNVDDVPVASQQASGNIFFMSLDGAGIRYLEPGGNVWQFLNDNIRKVYDSINVRTYLQTTQISVQGTSLFVGTRGNGMLRLTLNAASWAESSNGLPILAQNRAIIARPPVNCLLVSGGSLYAATRGSGVYRSDNQGASWISVNNGLPANANIFTLAESGNTLFAGSAETGVYRLTSQGNWSEVSTGLTSRRISALLSSNAELYAATDGGGVFRFLPQSQNWQAINAGLPDLSISSLAVVGTNLYAGTYNSGVFVSSTNGVSWSPLNTGLTAFEVRTLTVSSNTLFAGTLSRGIFRFTGNAWTPVNKGLPQNLPTFCLITADSTLYAGTVYGVFRSSDQGQNWTQINAGLGNSNVYWLISRNNSLFAGTENGIFASQF